jgi:hypothetical protein
MTRQFYNLTPEALRKNVCECHVEKDETSLTWMVYRCPTWQVAIKCPLFLVCSSHIDVSSLSGYFFTDSDETQLSLCVVYAANDHFGCWQYSSGNNYKCLSSPLTTPPKIEGLLTTVWDTKQFNCETQDQKDESQDLKITCLHRNTRLRYARKDANGRIDSTLEWNIAESINHTHLLFLARDQNSGKSNNDGSEMIDFSYPNCCNEV